MPRVAITGHMNLAAATVPLVRKALRDALALYTPEELVGISCIAKGADSIFAETILELGGKLEVILPATDYRECKVAPDDADRFDQLVRRASTVQTMPFSTSNRHAYEAANEALIKSCDTLIAVWDGRSPVDRGGTAAVVDAAESQGVPVRIVWPEGARRE